MNYSLRQWGALFAIDAFLKTSLTSFAGFGFSLSAVFSLNLAGFAPIGIFISALHLLCIFLVCQLFIWLDVPDNSFPFVLKCFLANILFVPAFSVLPVLIFGSNEYPAAAVAYEFFLIGMVLVVTNIISVVVFAILRCISRGGLRPQ